MAVGDAHVFPVFLTPVLTQISFRSRRLLFSEVRGENTAEKKLASSVYPTLNHQGMSQTRSPLSHTCGASKPSVKTEPLPFQAYLF